MPCSKCGHPESWHKPVDDSGESHCTAMEKSGYIDYDGNEYWQQSCFCRIGAAREAAV